MMSAKFFITTIITLLLSFQSFGHDGLKDRITRKKGDLNFIMAFPYVNNYYFQPEGEGIKRNTGFLGSGGDLEYFFQDNKFVSFSCGAALDFFIPFPAVVDYEGPQEVMYTSWLSATNNHYFKHFEIGYGLSYSKNTWRYIPDRYDPEDEYRESKNKSLGLMFKAFYHTKRSFRLGVIYRPGLLSLNHGSVLKYDHLLSIEFAWRLRVLNL